jgi:hypothetical protein
VTTRNCQVMAPFKPLPPVEYIRGLLDYDPETGEIRWKDKTQGRRPGSMAGTVARNGYIAIAIAGRKFLAHRLAWYMATGEDPAAMQIDHINGDKADNRFSNLRLATHAENIRNSPGWRKRDGYKGAHLVQSTGRWRARIYADGVELHLGTYDTPEEAHAVYKLAASELHGEFARAA